jgi:membrane protein YqaA with SNARE-associated domain
MLQRLYRRVLALSASRHAPWWLAAVAFAESSFFPIPPDVLLIPMALARPERAWRLALICTVASVAGGALGYYIGYALFDVLAAPIIQAYGLAEKFKVFQTQYAEWGLWIILGKGAIPIIPYKLVTITAGAAQFNFVIFMLASVLVRASRFYVVAALVWRFGPSVQVFIERRLALVTSGVAVGVVGGFVLVKYLL